MKMKKTIAILTTAAMLSGFVAPLANPMQVLAFEQEGKSVKEKRNVMYYGDWSIWGGQGSFYPKDIPAEQLTHLNYAFMDFDANGDLVFTDEDAAVGAPVGQDGVGWQEANSGALMAIQELRVKNPNMKIGISLGGWSKSGDFSDVAANPTKRANFVKNVMKFIEYTNMDFVDVDWEFPGEVRQPDFVDNKNDEGTPHAKPEDKQNYITLLQDLRMALDKQGTELGKKYELSVALPAPKAKVDLGIDVDALFKVVDFANVMSYDMRGAWDDTSGHQTGLFVNPNEPNKGNNLSVDETVNYLIENGAASEKIVVGAAYYTRGWKQVDKGKDASLPGLFGKAEKSAADADQTPSYGAVNEAPLKVGDGGRSSGVWSYRSLDKLKANYPGIKEYWDDVAKAPYLYDEKTGAFFTYDNVRSIQEKAKYVNEKDLGGVIGWMASQDAPTTDPKKRDELTKATKEGLFGQAELQKYEIKDTELNITATVTSYKEAWGNNQGYDITIKNNEKLEEGSKVLKAVEKGAETIKAPKLYIKTDGPLQAGDYLAGTVTNEKGYAVLDLASVYDGRTIEPGKTYSFKVKGDAKISGIELVQRMSKTGPDMNRQTIYGDSTGTPSENTAPTFTGLANKTIKVGEAFNPLVGVTATDKEDGDLTSAIKVEGTVDTSKAENYTLTYKVSDSKGLTTTVNRVITVEEKSVNPPTPEVNEAPVITGATDKTITVGTSFNALAGVTATDKEEGNLTSSMKVTGTVDTAKAGTYKLTYTVSDSKGATTTQDRTITVVAEVTPPPAGSNFGVGQGIQWPVQVNAPFVDVVSWITKPEYNNNGAANLAKLSADTGVNFFNVGFIQSTSSTIKDGKVQWGFGGYSVLNEDNKDNAQYNGIKKSIKDLRAMGGDALISLGGLNGTAIWEVTSDVDVLYNTYKELVDGFGLTRLDLDIEGGAQDKQKNIQNAKAIKKLQDATGVKIVLTLPVLPSGLTQVQLDVVEAYLSQGVDVSVVNIMTMCYGQGTLLPGENYGTASLRAVDSTKDQLKDYYKRFAGKDLTDAQVYGKIGTTPSIGFEGSAHPIFTTEWAKLIVDHATEKGLAMTSFWSMNRDALLESNEGVKGQYEFTNIFKEFGKDNGGVEKPNTAPTFAGVTDKEIFVGEAFNVLAGVIANDKEDGNLTPSMKVTGVVDTTKAGKYTVTYTVTDSKGLTTTATRVITVKEKPPVSGDTFDPNKVYLGGDKVIYKGDKYTAKWWTQGGVPEGNQAWEKEVISNGDGSLNYVPGGTYVGGNIVMYNGQKYKAKWWTTSTPGSDDSWQKL